MAAVSLHRIKKYSALKIIHEQGNFLTLLRDAFIFHFISKIYVLFLQKKSILIRLLGNGSWNLDIIKEIMAIWSSWLPVRRHKPSGLFLALSLLSRRKIIYNSEAWQHPYRESHYLLRFLTVHTCYNILDNDDRPNKRLGQQFSNECLWQHQGEMEQFTKCPKWHPQRSQSYTLPRGLLGNSPP